MLEILTLILVICITFLVTDYRRHLEIKDLEASREAELDHAFDVGFKAGRVEGLIEMRKIQLEDNRAERIPTF